MNTDFYYEIGHSHIVCEDYALAGQIHSGLTFAIVSDGCSSSRDVDVGARVLSHCAKEFVLNSYAKNPQPLENLKASEFFVPIIASANDIMNKLMLEKFCLDCTLLLALSNGKETRVFAYGDGCIVVKRKNGSVEYTRIEYDAGAPYYLSYSLDERRKNCYFVQYPQKVIVHDGKIESGVAIENPFPRHHEVNGVWDTTTWTFTDLDFITLISDGIMTYEKVQNGKSGDKIPLGRVINDISSYKNFSGQFVERRMNRFKKDCQKENIGHYDDIGVATIYMG